MEFYINWFIEFVLHMDVKLAEIVAWAGSWSYIILFIVIFCETGLVVTPFLPGDSLLFAAGALAGTTGAFNPVLLFVLMATRPFWVIQPIIGSAFHRSKVFSGNVRFLKKEYWIKPRLSMKSTGGKTILLARFIPSPHLCPFVAGVGKCATVFHLVQLHRRNHLDGSVHLRRVFLWNLPLFRTISPGHHRHCDHFRDARRVGNCQIENGREKAAKAAQIAGE
jgi:membrane protein DedA with SNARE-associated domain